MQGAWPNGGQPGGELRRIKAAPRNPDQHGFTLWSPPMHPMLVLIFAVFIVFGGALGFVSVWSNRK
jgi:hypothetical protein